MDNYHPDIQAKLAEDAKQRSANEDHQRANPEHSARPHKFPLERMDDAIGNPEWFWPAVLGVVFILFGLAGAIAGE